MRTCEGLVDSLLYVIKACVNTSDFDSKVHTHSTRRTEAHDCSAQEENISTHEMCLSLNFLNRLTKVVCLQSYRMFCFFVTIPA